MMSSTGVMSPPTLSDEHDCVVYVDDVKYRSDVTAEQVAVIASDVTSLCDVCR